MHPDPTELGYSITSSSSSRASCCSVAMRLLPRQSPRPASLSTPPPFAPHPLVPQPAGARWQAARRQALELRWCQHGPPPPAGSVPDQPSWVQWAVHAAKLLSQAWPGQATVQPAARLSWARPGGAAGLLLSWGGLLPAAVLRERRAPEAASRCHSLHHPGSEVMLSVLPCGIRCRRLQLSCNVVASGRQRCSAEWTAWWNRSQVRR